MRIPSPLWGCPSEEPLQQLERAVEDLYDLLDEQHTCWEDMSEVTRQIQQGMQALMER